jgi:hypothetical protein
VGERRSVRTAAQQQPSDRGGSRIKQKSKTKSKAFQEEKNQEAQSRVPVTALIAWPRFHSKSRTTGRQTDGSTGCTENAQHAPSETIRSSRVRMEAWRQWLLGGREEKARRKSLPDKMKQELS